MKSPFVRFSRFVRSPLSMATLGLCTLWGCRHLPTSRHTTEYMPSAYAPSDPVVGSQEESAVANNTDSSAGTPAIVSLSEGDTYLPIPHPTVAPEQPGAKVEQPESEPMETSVAETPNRELPTEELRVEQPVVSPKIGVPPEPVPTKELDLDFDEEPQADVKPKAKPKELFFDDDDTAVAQVDPVKPAPTPVSALDNEVFSVDSYCDGLVFDSQGFGYVSHKNQIVRFSPSGESSVWATLASPKGHRIEPEGTHLVCDVERRSVLRLSFEGKVVGVAAKDCDGTPFRAPYDISVDPRGGFYFGSTGLLGAVV